jgi:hypothetical protein
MTFESPSTATGELVGTYPEHDEPETNLRAFNVLDGGRDAVRSCGLILARTLLSVALILGFGLLLTIAILRVACSAFDK